MESAVEDDDGPPVETWWQRLPRRWLWCVVACLVITTGCGDGAGNEAPNRIPDLTRVIRPGEPVDSIGTEVHPEASSQRVRSFFDDADTLIVGELTDSAGLAFGEITDATASRNGVIYALDGSAKRVFVIDAHDGGHVQTVGGRGTVRGSFRCR